MTELLIIVVLGCAAVFIPAGWVLSRWHAERDEQQEPEPERQEPGPDPLIQPTIDRILADCDETRNQWENQP